MVRYWVVRCASFALGLSFLVLIYSKPFELSFSYGALLIGGSVFLLYGIRPRLVLEIFKLDPDEDLIAESKKDLNLSLESIRSKKDS
jgi:hypothetical protein